MPDAKQPRRHVLIWALGIAGALLGGYLIVQAEQGGRLMPQSDDASFRDSIQCPLPLSDEEIKQRLSAEQYHVTREGGTERPFANPYWNHHEPGLYVDPLSGEPLFASTDKFDSRTGWPSFTRPVKEGMIEEKQDASFGMVRVEVRSKSSGSHLGHLFDDGPAPTGLRYCINSAALKFIPVAELEQAGYGQYLSLFNDLPPAASPQ